MKACLSSWRPSIFQPAGRILGPAPGAAYPSLPSRITIAADECGRFARHTGGGFVSYHGGHGHPPARRSGFSQSLPEFQQLFPDDAACAAYLERARWPDGFVCPHCRQIATPSTPSARCSAPGAARRPLPMPTSIPVARKHPTSGSVCVNRIGTGSWLLSVRTGVDVSPYH